MDKEDKENKKKKTKITLKEYENRRRNDKQTEEKNKKNSEKQDNTEKELDVTACNTELELDHIMKDITNTYSFMVPQPQPSEMNNIDTNNFDETISAVASIMDESIDETIDRAAEVVRECAIEFLEVSIISEEVEKAELSVIHEILEEEEQKKEGKRKGNNESDKSTTGNQTEYELRSVEEETEEAKQLRREN